MDGGGFKKEDSEIRLNEISWLGETETEEGCVGSEAWNACCFENGWIKM